MWGVLGLAVVLLTSGVPGVQAAAEAPTWVEAKYDSASKAVDLRWSRVSGAVAYNIYRSESAGTIYKRINSVADPRYLDKTVKAGVTYSYRVVFLTSGFMESPFSDERSVGVDVQEADAKEPGQDSPGARCRLPGSSSAENPRHEVEAIQVGGTGYLYERGVFWARRGDQIVMVAAPVGAEVETLPPGAEGLQGDGNAISYWCGAFYGEKEGKFQVLPAPIGAIVSHLPDGCDQSTVDGKAVYSCRGICFSAISIQESTRYEVADCKK